MWSVWPGEKGVAVPGGEKGRDREIFRGAGIWGGSGSQSRYGWGDASGMRVHRAGAIGKARESSDP